MAFDIAIIGMAGKFPGAVDIQQLLENLRVGKDLIRTFTDEVVRQRSLPGQDYIPVGYLDDVDLFDTKLFKVSLAEAQTMDPHHRMLLESVYHTFESSGYSVDFFNGSNTGVFLAGFESEYFKHAVKFDPTLVTGNMKSAAAGRIARFYNLRGGAQVVDTACSSSLTALYFACNELLLGNLDYAIVGAANIILWPELTQSELSMGIESHDGRSRAFAADANGTGGGEAVCSVLITSLERARKQGDIIHAVIKSVAINQDGSLSANLTAPDAVAQSQVITRALRQAAVHPEEITYIEAHGTGTRLGDPIEVDGITVAYESFTQQRQYCALASIKSNFGHTNGVAGLSGLVKVVLSLRHHELYASLHCAQTNPLIDFSKTPVYVNTVLAPWTLPEGMTVRKAGLSSFGLMGTNGHAILEEFPVPVGPPKRTTGPYTLFVSANSAYSLESSLYDLVEFVRRHPRTQLADIAYTLMSGRSHYDKRVAFVVNDTASLVNQLEQARRVLTDAGRPDRLMFWFGDTNADPTADPKLIESMVALLPDVGREMEACTALLGEDPTMSEIVRAWIFWYAFYTVVFGRQIIPTGMFGQGAGGAMARVIKKKLSLREALFAARQNGLVAGVDELPGDDKWRELRDAKMVVVAIGASHPVERLLQQHALRESSVVSIVPSKQGLCQFFAMLYRHGVQFNWRAIAGLTGGEKIQLPAYPFHRRRCWLKEPAMVDPTSWLYTPGWAPAMDVDVVQDPGGTLLVVGDHPSGKVMRDAFRQDSGRRYIFLEQAQAFQSLDEDVYGIDLTVDGALAQAIDTLATTNTIAGLLYLGLTDRLGSASMERYFTVLRGLAPLLERPGFRLITCTRRALAINNQPILNPYAAALHGLSIGLAAEYPSAKITCIDIDNEAPALLTGVVRTLCGTADRSVSVGYYASQWWQRSLEKNVEKAAEKRVVLEQGVYMITGGAGGIGLKAAQWLAEQCPVKLVILGRRQLPERWEWREVERSHRDYETVQAFRAIEARGTEVYYYSVDLGDTPRLRQIMESIRTRFGNIQGVLHAAGIPGAMRFNRHSWASFEEVLKPKITGTVVIGEYLDPDKLLFFALFSSIDSLSGNERGTNYSAANAFLDSYATVLRQKHLPAFVINWPVWKETGMWHRAFGSTEDDSALSPHEGLSALHYILRQSQPQVLVVKGTPDRMVHTVESTLVYTDAAATEIAAGMLSERIRAIWCEVLQLPAVEGSDDFFNLGGHSLNGMQLISIIEKECGVCLEMEDLFEYSTLEAMCGYIEKLHGQQAAARVE